MLTIIIQLTLFILFFVHKIADVAGNMWHLYQLLRAKQQQLKPAAFQKVQFVFETNTSRPLERTYIHWQRAEKQIFNWAWGSKKIGKYVGRIWSCSSGILGDPHDLGSYSSRSCNGIFHQGQSGKCGAVTMINLGLNVWYLEWDRINGADVMYIWILSPTFFLFSEKIVGFKSWVCWRCHVGRIILVIAWTSNRNGTEFLIIWIRRSVFCL